MDVEKAARVRSYVQAQLAFVSFYGTDLLDPGGPQSETFDLQTPLLTARNPLVACQPEPSLSSVSACIEDRDSKGGLVETDSILTENTTGNYKRPLVKRPPAAKEENQCLSTLKKRSRSPSDPDVSSKPTKDLSPTKRRKRRHREKSKLPTGLSLLYSFAPKNVGPSRLTVSRSKANF
jgi:hypothetical protein